VTITLRPYQQDAVAAIEANWAEGITRPAVVIATGGGKTTIFSHLIGRHVEGLRKKGKRILVLAHRGELLEQAEARIKLQNPGVWTAIVKGNRGQKTHQFADVVIASIQTLARPKRRESVDRIGMVIVDECHTVGSKSYKDVLTHYGVLGGETLAVGFTATLTRMDGGLPDVWQSVAYQRKIAALIKDGNLVHPTAHVVNVPGLNLSTTRVTAGDLNTKDIASALEGSAAFRVIAEEYKDLCGERPGVVFMPNVATAHQQAEAFKASGITSECITGGMGVEERAGVYKRYNEGDTQVIVNCNVLIEGWDAPHTSVVVIGRPTINPGNYIQMVGRGLRLHPGKADCIVMDLSGASHRHSLAGVNDLESDCEASCDCNCLRCGCGDRCKCAIRKDCGCRCIEVHEAVAANGCRCAGTDDCPCRCAGEEVRPDAPCECANDIECGCKGEGDVKEDKEVEASALTQRTVMDILGETLTKSAYTWLKTDGGADFIQCGNDCAVFLLPAKDGSGCFIGVTESMKRNSVITKLSGEPLPPVDARAAAEGHVDAMGWTYSNRKASWRRTPASDAQMRVVKGLGREVAGPISKGAASDMIAVAKVSRCLDSRLKAWGYLD
jgi:superfamily II DNA or RNA helicase